ncbi:13766_t:CDS:2, partial [Dentiscutata erythropus]
MTETKLLQSSAFRKALSNPLYKIYTANNDIDYAINREASLGVAISITPSLRLYIRNIKIISVSTNISNKVQTKAAQFIQQAKATYLDLIVARDFNSNINQPNQSKVVPIITHFYQFEDNWIQFAKQIRENLRSFPISNLVVNNREFLNHYTNIWYSIVKQAAKNNILSSTTELKVFHIHSFKAAQLHRRLKVANKTLAIFKSVYPLLMPEYIISQINKELKTLSDLTGILTLLVT